MSENTASRSAGIDGLETASWRDSLESIRSLGSQAQPVTRLADLHQARADHLSMFFTPLSVVRLMWGIAEQACALVSGRRVRLFDPAIGSGRLFHYATPDRFELAGLDVHHETVRAVQEAAEAAGFACDIRHAGMEEARARGFDVALLNPPFSIHLESPQLLPLPCTTWGRYGRGTSAQSDEYALGLALHAADIVVGLVPDTLARAVIAGGVVGAERSRLRIVLRLPRSTFRGEGADVSTSVLVFGGRECAYAGELSVMDLDGFACPRLGLALEANRYDRPRLKIAGIDNARAVVERPVTADGRVRVVHSGRKIGLRFACGLVEARVLNAVYRERVYSTENVKLPRSTRYAGAGLLDMQALLATADPKAEFDRLLRIIREAGGRPDVDGSVTGYLARLIREKRRRDLPFGHVVYAKQLADEVTARALTPVALDPSTWTSPTVKQGDTATLRRDGCAWRLEKKGVVRVLEDEEAKRLFDMPAVSDGWVEVHPPLQRAFPQMAKALERRAKKLGLDRVLTWSFQFDDLIEVCLRPHGAVVGWKQGLGKARLAAAIILLRNIKHGLICMPAYLLDEYANRLKDAGFAPDVWQVIRSPAQLRSLRRVNVISYERLRAPLREQSKRTYAAALRHRVGCIINDEGEVMANPDSDRSRAMQQVAAPLRYILSGTPIGNYPRNLLPVAQYAVGDGVVGQPYGRHYPTLSEANARSLAYAQKGTEAFARYVDTQWTTNEFAETLTEGAKREVPRIVNVGDYRAWASRFVKRRVHGEPDVAACVRLPQVVERVVQVDWGMDHLRYYLKVADEFAQWYRETAGGAARNNLAILLARIGAVVGACNVPQRREKHGHAWCGGLTSKQMAVADLAESQAKAGEKTVIFATSPRLLELLERELGRRGIETVLFHGELEQARRNRDMDRRFRHGSATTLLASLGTMQSGWDLYQANRVIFANRSWGSRVEEQAVFRTLRPQQNRPVEVTKFHLAGSIDVYQDEMVKWKSSAAASGLDWGEPMPDDVQFVHLDTLLGRFVDDLAKLHGMEHHAFRKMLREAA